MLGGERHLVNLPLLCDALAKFKKKMIAGQKAALRLEMLEHWFEITHSY